MIIKHADDKREQRTILQKLLDHPHVDSTIKRRIEQELRNIQAGIRGEEEVAYEMKVHYGESANWMIIHDLRIEHGGLVAQVDHILINRWLEMWICESKHFSDGVAVNEHGEFSAFFGGKPYGVPSPIEQNNRHLVIIQRLFDSGTVKLPTRFGFTIKPDLKSLVLVSKGARISRPKVKIKGLDAVIKNDMLFKTIDKSVENANPLVMAKMVSRETLESLAKDLVKLHKPIEFNWLAKFGLSKSPEATTQSPSARPAVTQSVASAPSPPLAAPQAADSASEVQKVKQKLICNTCNQPVAYNVAKFYWFNKPKFGGNIYCMECQKKV